MTFDWLQPFIDWLGRMFQAVLDALNPIKLIVSLAQRFANLLPARDPNVEAFVRQLVDAFTPIVRLVGYLDFVINLPALLGAIVIVAIIEAAMFVPRAWRFVRSFIT